jgi:hypothetical protein
MKETTKKLRALEAGQEDFEWYPTTPEIMEAMEKTSGTI